MSYRARSNRRVAKSAKRRFVFSILIIFFLLYATLQWILPSFVGGISFISSIFQKPKTAEKPVAEDATLAPPVISIPFEATNSAQIDIWGYASSQSKVEIFLDDELKQTVDVSSDGSFVAKDIDLAIGTNNIYGKTLDNGRESLPSKTLKLIYDREKPPLEVYEPEDGKIIEGDKKIKVSGKTNPGIKIFINDSQIIVNQDGKFSIDQPLSDGDNDISIKAVNIASNINQIVRKVTYKVSPALTPSVTPTP